jgi:hypothetical protein
MTDRDEIAGYIEGLKARGFAAEANLLATLRDQRDEARAALVAECQSHDRLLGEAYEQRNQAEAQLARAQAVIEIGLDLANAADDVGVNHFDGDDMATDVDIMQTQTVRFREALAQLSEPENR